MPFHELSERERRVLEAVIQSYVETAEPAGSRTISRRFGLGVSAATIRNTMSELEEKGYLFHPHTSAGRIPTDSAYACTWTAHGSTTLTKGDRAARGRRSRAAGQPWGVLRRAASLSVVAQELGVAVGPRLDLTVLQRLELVRASEEGCCSCSPERRRGAHDPSEVHS
jgi:heat-inducible transcriptional repressor